MNNEKVLSLLSMARKAGKIAIGYDPTIEAIYKGKAEVVLLAKDISPKSSKGIYYAAEDLEIPVIATDFTMDEIGFAIGKRSGILGLTDMGFANKMQELLSDN